MPHPAITIMACASDARKSILMAELLLAGGTAATVQDVGGITPWHWAALTGPQGSRESATSARGQE